MHDTRFDGIQKDFAPDCAYLTAPLPGVLWWHQKHRNGSAYMIAFLPPCAARTPLNEPVRRPLEYGTFLQRAWLVVAITGAVGFLILRSAWSFAFREER